jgi:glycosyl transferase family 25
MSANAFQVYVINLDRSPARLAAVKASADAYAIPVNRVAAVEGRAISAKDHPGVDVARFERVNGRTLVPGELGCYLSHIKALEAFLADGCEIGLICEDDIAFTDDTLPLMTTLAATSGWDVVKLFNFRYRGFLPHRHLQDGWAIGRCLHGPSGSSAAYAVTREGARRLRDNLLPMMLPFDVALERGWKGSIRFYTTDRRAIGLQRGEASTIVGQGGLIKYPFYRRGGTLVFRATEYVRRMAFALRGAATGSSR